ncbi:hypothetical protein J5690_02510, partial [bacterium]|nr:hypothetical protein [bacterium]
NAFFVREDVKNSVPEVSAKKAFKQVKYRESRDKDGNLTFLSLEQGRKIIGDLEVVDTETGKFKKIKDLHLS